MPQRLLQLPAPAKLNLLLHVVGVRPDGYHDLQMLFALIDLTDLLDVEEIPEGIERTGDVVGDPEKDLCVRAARALQEHSGCRRGARIRVTKRIPSGAGLGGGSSDAATTLIALNLLWDLDLSREELLSLALPLGADVPFFVYGRSAWAQGVGEKLSPAEIPAGHAAVVMPPAGLPTPTVFRALHDGPWTPTPETTPPDLAQSWPALPGRNDLQECAVRLCPETARALEMLGPGARMTGSGAAVFRIVRTADEAVSLVRDLPAGFRGWSCPLLPVHPLRSWVRDEGRS